MTHHLWRCVKSTEAVTDAGAGRQHDEPACCQLAPAAGGGNPPTLARGGALRPTPLRVGKCEYLLTLVRTGARVGAVGPPGQGVRTRTSCACACVKSRQPLRPPDCTRVPPVGGYAGRGPNGVPYPAYVTPVDATEVPLRVRTRPLAPVSNRKGGAHACAGCGPKSAVGGEKEKGLPSTEG